MIREIVKDPLLLSRKSEPAAKDDIKTAQDLLDTLIANAEYCVGMAANMIGECKTIMAVQLGRKYEVLINPAVVSFSGEKYTTEEGCLSLTGVRSTERYPAVTVEYLDMKFRPKKRTFRGFEAQIVQHELDHFEGRII